MRCPLRWKKKASPSRAKKIAITPVGCSRMNASERSTICDVPVTSAMRIDGSCRFICRERIGCSSSVRMSNGMSARALWPSHSCTRASGLMFSVVKRSNCEVDMMDPP